MAMDRSDRTDGHWGLAERRMIWIALIVAGGIGGSLVFACATPFAALATLAALKTERRDTLLIVGLVWLANQVIGYGLLGYPHTWDSLGWGLAIGIAAFLALLAAKALSPVRGTRLAISLPFVGAFATYEMSLYIAGFMLPGGEDAFTAGIVGQILVVNLIALIGLLAVHQIALAIGLLSPEDAEQGTVGVTG